MAMKKTKMNNGGRQTTAQGHMRPKLKDHCHVFMIIKSFSDPLSQTICGFLLCPSYIFTLMCWKKCASELGFLKTVWNDDIYQGTGVN